MEEKLKQVQGLMDVEKQKRSTATISKEGSKWGSATTNQPIAGYDKVVMEKIARGSNQAPRPKP